MSAAVANAIVETTFGGTVWDVIDHAEIERIRNSGPSGNSPAWRNWYDQQAIAKVLKRVLKFCPKSRELARAIALDDLSDANVHQAFDVDIPVLPAEVARTEPERQAEEIRRQAASQGSEGGRNSEEPPAPGGQERELVPVQAKAPAQDEVGSAKGGLGF